MACPREPAIPEASAPLTHCTCEAPRRRRPPDQAACERLAISARWYADLFDLELANEFFEAGAVRGVVLADHDAGFVIGLREREHCASRPVLDGFDVCAFMLRTAEDMSIVMDRCAALDIDHGDVDDRGDFGLAMDISDPDGTVLRFVAGAHTEPPGAFAGIELGSVPPIVYDRP